MKTKKRLFALPVAVVLALILAVAACALTGCGENEKDTSGDTPKYVHGLTFHFVENVEEVFSIALLDEKVDDALDLTVEDDKKTTA